MSLCGRTIFGPVCRASVFAALLLLASCGKKGPAAPVAPAAPAAPAVPRAEPIRDLKVLKAAAKKVFDEAAARRVDPLAVAAVAASIPSGSPEVDDSAFRSIWIASELNPVAATIADDACLRIALDAAADPRSRVEASRGVSRGGAAGRIPLKQAVAAIGVVIDSAPEGTWAALSALFWLAERKPELADIAKPRLEQALQPGNNQQSLRSAVDAAAIWTRQGLLPIGEAAPFFVRAAATGEQLAEGRATSAVLELARACPELGPAIASSLSNPDAKLRLAAVELLGNLNRTGTLAPETLKALESVAGSDADEGVRDAARAALKR